MKHPSAEKEVKYLCVTCLPKYNYSPTEYPNDFNYGCQECGRSAVCIGVYLKSRIWPGYKNNYMSQNKEDDEQLNEALKTLNKKSTTPMKQLNITLQEAKELWRECWNTEDKMQQIMKERLSKTWTAEELEEKEGYTWEESFSGGYRIIEGDNEEYPKVGHYSKEEPLKYNRDMFKTKEQAESALAFAQLSHIVDNYNKDKFANTKNGHTVMYNIIALTDGTYKVSEVTPFSCVLPIMKFLFLDENDAKTSIRVNKSLWDKYFMINHINCKIVNV